MKPGAILRPLLSVGNLLLVLALILPLACRHTALGRLLFDPEALRQFFEAHRGAGVWWFLAAATPILAAGGSRLLICAVAGMMFGFWEGLGLSQVVTLASAVGVYAAARHLGGEVSPKVRAALETCGVRSGSGGLTAVFVLRQLPLPGLVLNVAMARAGIPPVPFVAGSLVGYLPAGVPAVALGCGIGSQGRFAAWAMIAAAVAGLVLAGIMVRRIRRQRGVAVAGSR